MNRLCALTIYFIRKWYKVLSWYTLRSVRLHSSRGRRYVALTSKFIADIICAVDKFTNVVARYTRWKLLRIAFHETIKHELFSPYSHMSCDSCLANHTHKANNSENSFYPGICCTCLHRIACTFWVWIVYFSFVYRRLLLQNSLHQR